MNKAMKIMFLMTAISITIGLLWSSLPFIKENVHALLDPSAGRLLSWNPIYGLLILAATLTMITTLLQKYTTDQAMLRKIKEEQKILQAEIKKLEHDPQAAMKKQGEMLEVAGKTMDITMRPLLFTVIPFILFLRWFGDFFTANPVKIFGLSWIWAYLIFSITSSIIFRKLLDVA